MKKQLVLILAMTTLATPLWAADAPYTCGSGMLRDVEAITETIATRRETRVKTRRNHKGEVTQWAETSPGERREKSYLLTIELDDMQFTGRASGDLPWNYNPMRLVINDAIGVCVTGSHLILKRPDGKNFKVNIVRAVRVTKETR